MDKSINTFLQSYLDTLPATHPHHLEQVSSGYFCVDEESANNCSELIYNGFKTACCSFKHLYEKESEPLPKEGNVHIVTNWPGEPGSIIETTYVQECKFRDVGKEFAAAEGEGDKSLTYWRQVHWDFFKSMSTYRYETIR